MPEEFDNGALFLRLGVPSTPIHHENGAFPTSFRGSLTLPPPGALSALTPGGRKMRDLGTRLENARLKTAFRFRVDRKYFKNRAFLKTNIHGDCRVFKFPCCSVDEA